MKTAEAPAPRPACPVCHRLDPSGQSWAVCPSCVSDVTGMLGEILDYHALAPAALERGSRTDAGPAPIHRDPPAPLDLTALELAAGTALIETDQDTAEPPWTGLESWELDWRRMLDIDRPYGEASAHRLERARGRAEETTLLGCVRFLRTWWPQAAERHPAADEFAADVRAMHAWAKNALRIGEQPVWTFPCPGDLDNGALCGYRLRVTHDGRDVLIRCRRCERDWTLQRLRLVGRAAGTPAWVDAESAARALQVTTATLRRMAARGDITRRGDLYDIGTHREETG